MKNLFKNAFKSFYKNKTALILVSVMVFLSTTLFTLLTSVGISFRTSYNDVVINKKLHDFISKEKYDLSGKLKFEEGIYEEKNGIKTFKEGLIKTEKLLVKNFKDGAFSTDKKYIYIQGATGDSDSIYDDIKKGLFKITDESKLLKQNVTNSIIRIKIDDFLISSSKNNSNDKLKLVKIIPTKIEGILIDILSTNGFSPSKKIPFHHTTKTIDYFHKNIFAANLSHSKKDLKNLTRYVEKSNMGWVSIPNIKYSKKTNWMDLKDIKSNSRNITITNKVTFKKFVDWITKTLGENKYYKEEIKEYYHIKLSERDSTGIFKALLQESSNANSKFSTKKKILNWIDKNGLNLPHIKGDSFNDSENVKKIEALKAYALSFALVGKRENYLNKINAKYSKYLDYRINESVNVSNGVNNYKVVKSSNNEKMNQIKLYSGYSFPRKFNQKDFQPFLEKILKKEKVRLIDLSKKDIDFSTPISSSSFLGATKHTGAILDKSKKFKWVLRWNKIIKLFNKKTSSPKSRVVIDPTSNFAIVSPGYVSQNKIKFVDPKKLMSDPQTVEDLIFSPEKIHRKYPESIIKVGEVAFLAIGSGIQPDYSFPIISGSKPVPNKNHEAILFANESGYLRTHDSYRGNEHENYISFRWKDGINLSNDQKDKILYESKPEKVNGEDVPTSIEAISRQMMSWPPNVQIVSKWDDTKEQIVLAPQRISFLAKIQKTLELIILLTTTMLIFATGLFISIFLKKHINGNKKQFGILMANGYTKHQISVSNIVFALVIMIIPTIMGYLTGFSIQYVFISIFNDYWTLPVFEQTFSWITFSLYFVIPFLFVVIYTYLISRWEFRMPLTIILSGSRSKIGSWFSGRAIGAIKYANIKTKISLSLFMTNISKMLMIFVVATSSIITISIGFTSMGKFQKASAASNALTNYKFSINLSSPTIEGGAIKRLSPIDIGGDFLNQSVDEIYEHSIIEAAKSTVDKPTWMIPNLEDAKNQKGIKYLENKLQFQSLLNVQLGFGSLSVNPWVDAGEPIMPDGQRMLSDKQRKIFNKYGITLKANQKYASENWYKDIQNHKLSVPNPKNINGIMSIKEKYLKFIFTTLKDIFSDFKNKQKYLPTLITYKSVLLNNNDETYTYLKSQFTKKGIGNKQFTQRLSIIGYKKDTRMINLDLKYHDALSKYKPKDGEIPIIINTYFSKIHKLNKGSTIKMNVGNIANRYTDTSNQERVFKVIDTFESYNGAKAFTTQAIANKILNLDKLTDKFIPFNGVYTKNSSPALLNSIPLYSVSGYYPSYDIINSNDKITKDIVSDIKANGSAALKNDIKSEDHYIIKYSKSPYIAAFSDVDWAKVSQYAFDSTLKLSTQIIFIIQTMALIFSIIFIIIITMLLISDNKKYIATMKVMGYKFSDINKIFFKSILPSFIIALVIAIPITFGLLIAMNLAIVNFGQIYIPLQMVGWEIILASFVASSIFALVYWATSKQLKNQSALEAFKE